VGLNSSLLQSVTELCPSKDTCKLLILGFVYIVCIKVSKLSLSEGHISYFTTDLGPDILRNVIVSGYAAFYQVQSKQMFRKNAIL